ncbi:hypothetical protein C6I20_12340 [Aeromicrobium sp. A1-2]|uniref:hypothetical protein n=1 Tax=Aeromicrobium sp. A1-2 TaxID=2107713 RepID=UPI000E47A058|nr:hypothetical protein [Aeromicrobium sp. A1-2]AXT85894.1 hypothetical protein C6I20_12340 [Aeromicrobium sp. A1-2]
MTVLDAGPLRAPRQSLGLLPTWTLAVSVAVPVLARLALIARPPRPDEGGFLLVGAQWSGAGRSLYGDYWVDRPPLLITIFRTASSLGGLTALRLIGCLAVALVVIGSARVAGLLGGPAAARWAAVAAAALCLSPWLGGYEVDGELLAAPLVLAGIAAGIHAVRADRERPAVAWAAIAGVCGIGAVLVKQNIADAAVFGVLAVAISWWCGRLTARRSAAIAAGGVAGALAAALVVAGWTSWHGTSLTGVLDAMYPFRLRAGKVLAEGGRQHSTARLISLVGVALSSGIALLLLPIVGDTVLRRRRDPLWWALIGTMVFAGVSVLLGGTYWHHYLVELVAPVSVAAGVVAARHGRVARVLIAYAVVAAMVGWGMGLTAPPGDSAQSVGSAIAAAAKPGDTIVNAWGGANLTYASGLPSPYVHLWSLPVKTLDPHLAQLDTILTGPSAPTWFVTRRHLRSWGLDTSGTRAILSRDYHRVGAVCGRRIYLRDGIDRPAPRVVGGCHGSGGLRRVAP